MEELRGRDKRMYHTRPNTKSVRVPTKHHVNQVTLHRVDTGTEGVIAGWRPELRQSIGRALSIVVDITGRTDKGASVWSNPIGKVGSG